MVTRRLQINLLIFFKLHAISRDTSDCSMKNLHILGTLVRVPSESLPKDDTKFQDDISVNSIRTIEITLLELRRNTHTVQNTCTVYYRISIYKVY